MHLQVSREKYKEYIAQELKEAFGGKETMKNRWT